MFFIWLIWPVTNSTNAVWLWFHSSLVSVLSLYSTHGHIVDDSEFIWVIYIGILPPLMHLSNLVNGQLSLCSWAMVSLVSKSLLSLVSLLSLYSSPDCMVPSSECICAICIGILLSLMQLSNLANGQLN